MHPRHPPRTPAQIREHYEIEKELASRLKSAGREERRHLYPLLYSELYRRVPHHPRVTQAHDPARTTAQVAQKMAFLERFLKPDMRFMEIGAGDGSLSMQVARRVGRVYAVDVARQIPADAVLPGNFEMVILEDGCSIPLPDNSIDLAYSNQVMEHIHPEDAFEQLREIHRTIAPGGSYLCITPNGASGPHDVSFHFDEFATAFHVKEYRLRELTAVFRDAGFRRVTAYAGVHGFYFPIPAAAVHAGESILLGLPFPVRKRLRRAPVIGSLLFLTVLGHK